MSAIETIPLRVLVDALNALEAARDDPTANFVMRARAACAAGSIGYYVERELAKVELKVAA